MDEHAEEDRRLAQLQGRIKVGSHLQVCHSRYQFKKGYRLIWLLAWLFPGSVRTIVQEELTNALHPDFGWYVMEQEALRHMNEFGPNPSGRRPLR